MNDSVLLNLRSNRGQDFEMVHHRLEEAYPELLRLDAEQLIPFGLRLVNKSVKKQAYYFNPDKVFDLNINGIRGKLISDYSFYEPDDEREYGPLSHMHKIFAYLGELAGTGKEQEAKKVIQRIMSCAEASATWRELIRFFTRNPILFREEACGLLVNEAVFICDETFYEAGKLIEAIWQGISLQQQKAIEKTILAIKKTGAKFWDENEIEIRIAGILTNIPTAKLRLAESKKILAKLGAIKSKPLVHSSIIQPYYESEEEKLRNAGVNPLSRAEVKVYKQEKLLNEYNTANNSNNEPNKKIAGDYLKLLPVAEKLFASCQTEDAFNDRLQNTCDKEVSLFAKLVSKRGDKLKKEERAFVEKVAFHFIDKALYTIPHYSNGKLSDRGAAYSSNARTIAALTLTELLESDKSGKVAPKVLELMSDNMVIVRTKTLIKLDYYWEHHNEDFWNLVKSRSAVERDALNLRMLIRSVTHSYVIKSDQEKVEEIAWIIALRLIAAAEHPTDDLWKTFGMLLLNLVVHFESQAAKNIVHSFLGNTGFEKSILFEIIRNIIPPDSKNNYVANPKKNEPLITIVHDITANRFKQLILKGTDSDDIKDDITIINSVVEKFFYSLNDGRKPKKPGSPVSDNKVAFYKKIKPILQLVADESLKIEGGFMVAQTAYYFIQILNSVADEDTEFVLTTAASIVRSASVTGFTYEESTLREIVALTERILADHKALLMHKEQFENLLTILDLFVDSGWEQAIELTWRLKEIF